MRAIDIVDIALKSFPRRLCAQGNRSQPGGGVGFPLPQAVFIDDLDEAPPTMVIFFRPRRVPEVRDRARAELRVIDATCPSSPRFIWRSTAFARGSRCSSWTHRSHDEGSRALWARPGTIQLVETENDVARLSVPRGAGDDPDPDHPQPRRDPRARGGHSAPLPRRPDAPRDDICYATQNRRDAVKELLARGTRSIAGRSAPKQLQQPTVGRRGSASGRCRPPDRQRREIDAGGWRASAPSA